LGFSIGECCHRQSHCFSLLELPPHLLLFRFGPFHLRLISIVPSQIPNILQEEKNDLIFLSKSSASNKSVNPARRLMMRLSSWHRRSSHTTDRLERPFVAHLLQHFSPPRSSFALPRGQTRIPFCPSSPMRSPQNVACRSVT
jgi:hypothetical protein